MKAYRIERLPQGFSKLAFAAYNSLDGYLYIRDDKIIMTDEADDLDSPRVILDTMEAFEDWLIATAASWLSEGKDDPMVAALNRNL